MAAFTYVTDQGDMGFFYSEFEHPEECDIAACNIAAKYFASADSGDTIKTVIIDFDTGEKCMFESNYTKNISSHLV